MGIVYRYLDKVMERTFGRIDGAPAFRYARISDYGVHTEPFSFYSGKWKLVGDKAFPKEKPYKGLIVFFHGFGAGREAYSSLIADLTKGGYLVYSYDVTGCMQSEGDAMRGFPQGLVDQKNFFAWLEKDEDAKGLTRYAVGHSFGGFVCFGALQEEYDVKSLVVMAGFPSAYKMMLEVSPEAKKQAKIIKGYLKSRYGKLGLFDAVPLLKTTDKNVLYIQGEFDKTVDKQSTFDVLKKEIQNPHVSFFEAKGKAHQPYWTKKAQDYFLNLTVKHKYATPESTWIGEVDYGLLSQDDPEVMKRIFDFLES